MPRSIKPRHEPREEWSGWDRGEGLNRGDETMSVRQIRHAIRRKQPISATYLGRRRILCPHVIGTKNGVWNVLSYQSGGESGSGLTTNPAGNWRCMRVSELSRVASAPHLEWRTAARETRPQTCVDVVDTEAAY